MYGLFSVKLFSSSLYTFTSVSFRICDDSSPASALVPLVGEFSPFDAFAYAYFLKLSYSLP